MKAPIKIGAGAPRRGSTFSRNFFWFLYHNIGRWTVAGEVPDIKKLLVIGVPHTSNWDGTVGFPMVLALGLRWTVMAKHTLFRWPYGGFIRWLGMIPIERHKSKNRVQAAIDEFESRDKLWMGIAPEGTRRLKERWKTGFYHIALGAKVPIMPLLLDYSTKTIIFDKPYDLTGDMVKDLLHLEKRVQSVTAYHPELVTPALAKEEMEKA